MNRLSPLSKERIAELQAAKAETKALKSANMTEHVALKSANLTEHVALHNRMIEAINTYVPKLIEELSKGFKLKDNRCFYKKDQSRFDNLVQELSVEFGFTGKLSKVTFGIHCSSFHLVIQDCYTSGSTEANKGRQSIYELSSYVWDTNTNEPHEFKPAPYLSTKDILDAKAKTDELEKQIQELQAQLQQAKRTTDGFKAHL